jgi:hypothetical protein
VCAVLEWSALVGVPMRPEEIVDLMQTMNAPRVTHTNPDDDDQGAPPAEGVAGD